MSIKARAALSTNSKAQRGCVTTAQFRASDGLNALTGQWGSGLGYKRLSGLRLGNSLRGVQRFAARTIVCRRLLRGQCLPDKLIPIQVIALRGLLQPARSLHDLRC